MYKDFQEALEKQSFLLLKEKNCFRNAVDY
jgi:hypothetical protein